MQKLLSMGGNNGKISSSDNPRPDLRNGLRFWFSCAEYDFAFG